MNNCYLCASPDATKPLTLKDTFTSHNLARNPTSNYLCDRCAWCIPLRAFYWNETKKKYSAIFSRNWTWLLNGDNSYPKFGDTITEGKDTLQVVTELPTRVQIREWLINPPTPPFTICIAESGQKHILPWAQEATNRDYFPIQFELDTLYIHRHSFSDLLSAYESLMALGFSKTEINSGNYRSDRLMKCVDSYGFFEVKIAGKRGDRLLDLVGYVANVID